MLLSQLVNAQTALDTAFASPAMRIKPKSKIRPNEEAAAKAVYKAIETLVQEAIIEEVSPCMEDVLADVEINYGTYDDAGEKNEWEAELDAKVEEFIMQNYGEMLTQEWLGLNTIDTGLHNEDGILNFSKAVAKEIFKHLTFKKTQNQIFSACGIVEGDVFKRLQAHLATHAPGNAAGEAINADGLEAVISKIKAHVGPNADVMQLDADLDLASDSDDILMQGAIPRLGITADDAMFLQEYRLEFGSEGVQKLFDMVTDAVPLVIPASKAPPIPRKTPLKKNEKAATPEVEKAMRPGMIKILRDAGIGGKEVSDGLGISLASYNKYAKGETPFRPTGDQAALLRELTVNKVNNLLEALAEIDGTEVQMVH